MKAAVCREHGKPLSIEEIHIAKPEGTQVKVKIAACAICHSDIHYAEGAWKGRLPAVYGHEAAGVVVEVGENVKHLKEDDRVVVTLIRSCGGCFYCDQGTPALCGESAALDSGDVLKDTQGSPVIQGMKTGAFAEYVVVEASQVAILPADIRLETASLLACGVITGVGAVVNTARVCPGAAVVVIGVGGVGLNAVQGARLCGAARIIALDTEDEKLDVARRFGATHGINANEEHARKHILEITGGRGADFVFVTVGARTAMDQSYQYMRRGGEVVLVGMTARGVRSEFLPLNLVSATQAIRGSFMGQTRLSVDIPWLIEHYRRGRLKLDELISNRYSLDEINDAMENTLNGKSIRNVLVIDESL
ncbi:MAG: zinc-binding dehydrogenase [Gammaproteobacteria bacterium]|nr:zinc-binding dehydrogenase [Gammaproteobacteria bacterium]